MENGDKHSSATFLKTLFKNCTQGFINIRPPASNRFIPLSQIDSISSMVGTYRGENIYFSPVTRLKGNNSKSGIIEIPGIYVDLNKAVFEKGMEGFPLKPTIIVDSGDRYQCYWLLKEPATKKDSGKVEDIQRGLANHFNSKISITDALPLPGTFNHRHNPSHEVVLKDLINLDHKYTFNDFGFLFEPEPQRGSLKEEITQIEDIQSDSQIEGIEVSSKPSEPKLETNPIEKSFPLSPQYDPQSDNENSVDSPTSEIPAAESDNQAEGTNPQVEDELIGECSFDEGWIKLHRKIIENPIFKDSAALHLFIYLLLKVNHKPNRFLFNKNEILIERGQFLSGRKQISKETGISQGRVRRRVKLLKNLGMLTIIPTNKFSIITVCNYDYYQNDGNRERPAKRSAKNKSKTETPNESGRPASDQQATTNKNDKNIKIYVEGSDELRLATLLLEEIQRNKKDRNLSPFKQPNLQSWAKEVDLMMRRDSRKPERIQQVIKWCQGDSFWRSNILSTHKLKEKFDELEMKMESPQKRKELERAKEKPRILTAED